MRKIHNGKIPKNPYSDEFSIKELYEVHADWFERIVALTTAGAGAGDDHSAGRGGEFNLDVEQGSELDRMVGACVQLLHTFERTMHRTLFIDRDAKRTTGEEQYYMLVNRGERVWQPKEGAEKASDISS